MRRTFWLAACDLRLLARDRAMVAMLVAALALAVFALMQGARFSREVEASIASAAKQEAAAREAAIAELHAPEPRYWLSAADLRGYAFRVHVGFASRPERAGAALAIGPADRLPAVLRVRAESRDSLRSAAEIEHPGRLAVGRFELSSFVVLLWPLVLLALCAPVLTQDREAGRLRALRLQGVTPARLLATQVLARTGVASAWLVAVVVAAAWVTRAVAFDAAGLAALAEWSTTLLGWSLFWAVVAAMVAWRCATRVNAVFAGGIAWVVVIVLLPALLSAGLQGAAPMPSREQAIVAGRDAIDAFDARCLPGSPWSLRMARLGAQEAAWRAFDAHADAAAERRQALFAAWRWFSPASATSEALALIAGHDDARQAAFIDEARRHQQRLHDFFEAAIQQAAPRGDWSFRDFDAVPRFAH